MLTVLRNPAYLGKVLFRGTYYPAPHTPLIEGATFDAVARLLEERGENYSKRATNSSDYLLGGLVVCQQCGKHYIGTAAHGNV